MKAIHHAVRLPRATWRAVSSSTSPTITDATAPFARPSRPKNAPVPKRELMTGKDASRLTSPAIATSAAMIPRRVAGRRGAPGSRRRCSGSGVRTAEATGAAGPGRGAGGASGSRRLRDGEATSPASGRRVGNSRTSRIVVAPASSMTRRSMPTPRPPVGGMPSSIARR